MFRTLVASAAILVGASAAQAGTVDFTSLGERDIGTKKANIDGITLRSSGDSLFVGAGDIDNSICALDSGLFSCANDLKMTFDNFATKVMFTVGGFEAGDLVVASVESGRGEIERVRIESGGMFDLSSLGGIKSIFFDDRSSEFGVSYGDLKFVEVAAVPLPASLPLLLAGLGAFGIARRRRNKT